MATALAWLEGVAARPLATGGSPPPATALSDTAAGSPVERGYRGHKIIRPSFCDSLVLADFVLVL